MPVTVNQPIAPSQPVELVETVLGGARQTDGIKLGTWTHVHVHSSEYTGRHIPVLYTLHPAHPGYTRTEAGRGALRTQHGSGSAVSQGGFWAQFFEYSLGVRRMAQDLARFCDIRTVDTAQLPR